MVVTIASDETAAADFALVPGVAFASMAPITARRFHMPDKHTTQPPIGLPEMLQQELDSFSGTTTPEDLTKPAHERLRAVHGRIRQLQPERSALCISGGGIRSATFALGAVQALAKAGLLARFDFLSTVSGGGYLGSMLGAWVRQHPEGLAGVERELGQWGATASPEPEPAPLRHLRRFSNYLAPKLGLFSADGWALAATALRNLLLNWTVLVSILAAMLVVPWLGLLTIYACPPAWQLHAYLAGAFVCIAAATAYPGFDLPSFDNFHLGPRHFAWGWMIPLVTAFLLLGAWWAGLTNTDWTALAWMNSMEGLIGIVAFLATSSATGMAVCILWAFRHGRLRKILTEAREQRQRILVTVFGALIVVGCPASLVLWRLAGRVFPAPASDAIHYLTFGPPIMLVGFFAMNCLFVGFNSRVMEDDDREWWARAAGWVGGVSAAWLLLHGLVFYVPVYVPVVSGKIQAAIAASGGIIGFLGAKIAASSKTSALLTSNPETRRTMFLAGAAFVFFGVLSWLLSIALLGNFVTTIPLAWSGDLKEWQRPFDPLWLTLKFPDYLYWPFAGRVWSVLGGLVAVGLVMGAFVNANRFSLHSTYRNRLVRAYLGAARSTCRQPHPFTGFDPLDNFEMRELKRGPLFHVINIALNLVAGAELAWQERKADSFTVSRLHSGNRRLGYRPSGEYGGGITIGTALAVSGAAANPNSGYNSSPLLTFLMTLFNVRLGWWLGNPGQAGCASWVQKGPLHAIWPLVMEASGLTNEHSAYVELSDGGHFENLALYEMVLRRCRRIVVLDAEQDPDYAFEGLGNAVRKIRIDMGIPIEIEHLYAVSKDTPVENRRGFALGRIRYSVADPGAPDGFLLYIKPLIIGDEPTDIVNYAKVNESFPHEPTKDQFFSESQFESYRALGLHQMTEYLRSLDVPPTEISGLFPPPQA